MKVSAPMERHGVSMCGRADARAAGVIINTCGWVDGEGYALLCHAISTFEADVVLVIGNDRLAARLTVELPSLVPSECALVKLPRSGGVRDRDKEVRRLGREDRVKQYFYGPAPAVPDAPRLLSPSASTLPFTAVRVVQIDASQVASHQMPVGVQTQLSAIRVKPPVAPTSDLKESMLMVSASPSPASAATSHLLGFAVV
jgi:polyribonucleotide 5'-hydroxyl-kinase